MATQCCAGQPRRRRSLPSAGGPLRTALLAVGACSWMLAARSLGFALAGRRALESGAALRSRAAAPPPLAPPGSRRPLRVVALQAVAEGSKEYSGLTIANLKKKLRERGLPLTGKKNELVSRLEADDEEKASGPEKEEEEPAEAAAPEPAKPAEPADPNQKPKKEIKYGTKLPDPHEGKPDSIIDEEGRVRHLCLDGKYRRGDPASLSCTEDNMAEWISEWVVAARTGQLEGPDGPLPQMTFITEDPDAPGNPKGTTGPGEELSSEDVLIPLKPGPRGYKRYKLAPGIKQHVMTK